jgi:transcriptional regulator of nitric oxide reductase
MGHDAPRFKRKVALAAIALVFIATATRPGIVDATVFHSRSEIPHLAFPDADRVEVRDLFATPAERSEIERAARVTLDSDLVSVYEGYSGDRLLGYAMLDSHIVRTLPEALLIVLDPDGRVTATHVLAFHEPLDYVPGERWLRLYEGQGLSDDLRIGRGIVGITGATLSAHAVMNSVRRALAIYQVLLAGE